jgi:hypothetical protein
MPDVAFIGLTIAVFAVLAMAVHGVERLVGQAPESAGVGLPRGGRGAEHGTEGRRDYGSAATSDGGASVGAGGVGAHADGQVAR